MPGHVRSDGESVPAPRLRELAAAAAATAVPGGSRSSAPMLRSQAARAIQTWWRAARLFRHRTALTRLVKINREVTDIAARYYQYLAVTGGYLTHKQLLEVNEHSMRALLALDA